MWGSDDTWSSKSGNGYYVLSVSHSGDAFCSASSPQSPPDQLFCVCRKWRHPSPHPPPPSIPPPPHYFPISLTYLASHSPTPVKQQRFVFLRVALLSHCWSRSLSDGACSGHRECEPGLFCVQGQSLFFQSVISWQPGEHQVQLDTIQLSLW